MNPPPLPTPSKKRILPAVALAGVGLVGVHRLYVGKYVTGAVQTILLVVCSVLLGNQFSGITSMRTLDDMQDFDMRLLAHPVPVLILVVLGFWAVFDCILLAAGKFTDGAGRKITRWV